LSITHLGQPIRNHVTLGCFGTVHGDSSTTWAFFRIFPNGTAYDFTIPKGQFLVVTDVDWNYNTGEPNKLQTFSILMKMPKKEIRNVIFTSTIFGDMNGAGGSSVSMTTGLVISDMRSLEPHLESRGALNEIILRGYLIEVPQTKRRTSKISNRKHR
jgi:hypothetical protein